MHDLRDWEDEPEQGALFTTSVTLPKTHTPVFPNRCIVCRRPDPDASVSIDTKTVTWLTWLFNVTGEKVYAVAPACAGCVDVFERRYRFRKRMILLFSAICGIPISIVLLYLMGWPNVKLRDFPLELFRAFFGGFWSSVFMQLGLIAMACVGAVVMCLMLYSHPAWFDILGNKKTIEYIFRYEEYAKEFAELNGTVTDD